MNNVSPPPVRILINYEDIAMYKLIFWSWWEASSVLASSLIMPAHYYDTAQEMVLSSPPANQLSSSIN